MRVCCTKLLNLLIQSEYSLKDTFDAAELIKKIPKELLKNEEYTLISLDVVSLTVNIMLGRVYNQELIKTTLLKEVLLKMILNTYQKTAITFNNIIYEHKDGVSIEGSLGLFWQILL